jgi:DNA invertase Pin-like site-specific DNA recombinase
VLTGNGGLARTLARRARGAGRALPDHRGRARTKGSTGKLVLHIIGAIAEFERSLILERTMAGLKSAWAQGAKSGRRRLMAPADLVRAKELLASPGLKAADVAAMLKVSERTLFRELRAARDREEVGV